MRLTDAQLRAITEQQQSGVAPADVRIPPAVRKKRDNREHRIQVAIVQWFRAAARGFGVDPRLLFAIPNGALYGRGVEKVIRAKMLKAEGLMPGIPDLMLCRPSVERNADEFGNTMKWHALFVECKTPEGVVSPVQKELNIILRWAGYRVEVVRSVEQGIQVITEYLTP